jgi:hypothetical protein
MSTAADFILWNFLINSILMRKILLRTALRCSGLRKEWNNADGINYRYVLKRTKAVT